MIKVGEMSGNLLRAAVCLTIVVLVAQLRICEAKTNITIVSRKAVTLPERLKENQNVTTKPVAAEEKTGSVFDAAKTGDLDVVKSFLSNNSTDVNAKDASGKSVLDYAIAYNHVDIIGYLIDERGAANDRDMFTAAQKGQLGLVRYFIEKKHQDVESRDKEGFNALHWATEFCQMKVVRYLIEDRKMSVDSRDRRGCTALHWSAHFGHLELVRYLAENGADVNATTNYNVTVLYSAEHKAHIKVMKYLIEERSVPHDPDIYTAAKLGHLSMVRYFVEEKRLDIEAKDKEGWKALHWAAQNGSRLNVIKYLIEYRNQSVDSRDGNDWTALHWSAYHGNLTLVKYLVERGANVNARNNDSNAPLDLAISRTNFKVIKYLIGAPSVAYEGGIFTAAKNGQLSMVKFFLDEMNQDVDSRDEEDLSPLNVAAIFGRLDIVKYLIEERGQSTELKLHKTMLMAVASGQLEIVKYLVARGVSINDVRPGEKSLLDVIIRVSSTIFAAQQGDRPSDEAYLRKKAPLSLLKEKSYLKMIAYLMDEQGLVYVGDLFTAARDGHPGMVEYFIREKGQSMNSRDKQGWTALHWAASKNRLSVVKYLVDKGADASALDGENKTPLDIATEKKRRKTTKYLREKLNLELEA